jgi:hypothetical protein
MLQRRFGYFAVLAALAVCGCGQQTTAPAVPSQAPASQEAVALHESSTPALKQGKKHMNWKDLSPTERAAVSKRWCEEGSRYARDANAFIDRGNRLGPEQSGKEPEDTRKDLAETVLEAVREANLTGAMAAIREKFPPAYAPFIDLINVNGQVLRPLFWLESGDIVVRVGYQKNATTYRINDLRVKSLPGILSFGRSPNRRYYAVAREKGITIHDGWDGPTVTSLAWPKIGGTAGAPEVEELVPFPDGKRVLLGTRDAIVVLAPDKTTVLYPKKELKDIWLNNPHGAVSPDGSLIAIGDRLTCEHLIFNSRCEMVGRMCPLVDVAPCHASFSNDGRLLQLSSFMLYNGATVILPTSRFPGFKIDQKELDGCWFSKKTWPEMRDGLQKFDRDVVVLNSEARVYASAWRSGAFILGDAYGNVSAFDKQGENRWDHFIGSSICAIDLSADGRRLIASTYAGLLVILDLDMGEGDPYRIGTSTHREQRRWLFWKNEKTPLAW